MVRAVSPPPRIPTPAFAPGGPLLLASRSPRRRRMLEQAGIPYIALESAIDDGILLPGPVTPVAWVTALAYLKAVSGLCARPDYPGVVLGADTVCVLDGRIIGQPRDQADAERMLLAFEGRSHEVVTGVAILTRGRRELFADAATVRVGPLGALIAEYIASGWWRGKAGAYNLEDRLAAGWPIEFDGDPTTVMGLPMRRLVPRLHRLGVGTAGAGGIAA